MRPPSARTACLLVAAWALVVQLPALSGVLIWDDVPLLAVNDLYTNPARWSEAVNHALGKETFYWRPLATTSFLVETLLHGGAVWGYRLTGALLHAMTAALVCALAMRLIGSTDRRSGPAGVVFGLFAGALFAAHPITVEAATWPSGRFDGLAGLLCIAVLLARPRSTDPGAGARPPWGRLVLVGALSAAAMATKEHALLLPGFVLLLDLAERAPDGGWAAALRSSWRAAVASLVGIIVVLLVRADVLGYVIKTREANVAAAGDAGEHAQLVLHALGTYLLMLVQPFETIGPLHHASGAWSGAAMTVGALGGLALAGFGVRWLLARRPEGFLVAAFVLALAPVLQIVPLDLSGGVVAADRFVYLPAGFAFCALALVLGRRFARVDDEVSDDPAPDVADASVAPRQVLLGGLALLLVLGAYRALVVVPRWGSAESFWTWSRSMAPESDLPPANLFHVHWQAGRLDEAEALARELVERFPDGLYEPLLARALQAQGNVRGALIALDAAVARSPIVPELRISRGMLALQTGQASVAFDDFRTAISALEADTTPRFMPLLPRARAGLVTAGRLASLSVPREGEMLQSAARGVGPTDHEARVLLTAATLLVGDDRSARTWAEQLVPERTSRDELLFLVRVAARTSPDGRTAQWLADRASASGLPTEAVQLTRADAFRNSGAVQRAAGVLREILAADADSWDANVALWDLAFTGATQDDPIAQARRLTEIRPSSAIAWDRLGYTLYEKAEDVEGAEAAFRKGLEADPASALARFHLGMLLLRSEREPAGREELAKARFEASRQGLTQLVERIDAVLE